MDREHKEQLFTDSQMNHLVGTFRHIDALLRTIESAIADEKDGLFPHYLRDLSARQKQSLKAAIDVIRERMRRKLQHYGLGAPGPRTTATRSAESALQFIDVALDNLRPKEMRGYGPVSDGANAELQELINEFHSLTASALRDLKQDDEVAS